MVLNALAIDPRRAWKGPWRWFHEQMLDCCQPLSQVLQTGIVLDQVLSKLANIATLTDLLVAYVCNSHAGFMHICRWWAWCSVTFLTVSVGQCMVSGKPVRTGWLLHSENEQGACMIE